MTISTHQGKATTEADRAMLLGQIRGLMAGGLNLRRACAEMGINHNNFYRWTQQAAPLQDPKPTLKKGRPVKFELTEGEIRRLRCWRLVKGSVPLAVESFIAEGLAGDATGYFAALADALKSTKDKGERCRPELARDLRAHWEEAVNARRSVVWPLSIQRACRVTAQGQAQFRGPKAASAARGMERRGNMIRTDEGEVIPWYAGAIWESDDMSLNDPFRFHDAATGSEMLGRQALFTIDSYSLNWLGCTHVGRDRDSYRAEDIAGHFKSIVDAHGLPLIWRVERGRWDNNFIWGIPVGTTPEGETIRWGGLDAIIHVRDKFTSQGKANVEGSFDLLQALMDHGFNGQTMSIGRQRGEFEEATRQMLRAGRDKPDLDSLARFWNIEQSAEAVAKAMNLFNSRPKRRHSFGNELRVPTDLWAECVKRPLPADHAWRFCAVKTKATIRRGIIEVRAPHYPTSFRFRVHGSARMPNVHTDQGHEVLVAFTPSEAWAGCHVFNADRSARNREAYAFGEKMGVAEHMPDALQEDLYAKGYSPGANRAAAQVRKETRLTMAGTAFVGRRESHAQDSFGAQLTRAQGGEVAPTAATRSEPAFQDEGAALPGRDSQPAPARRDRGVISTSFEDFTLDEDEETAALSL
jgi:hypothetical protein